MKFFASDRKGTLPFKYTVVKGPDDYKLELDSDDLTSDSGVAPDEDQYSEEERVVAHAEDLHLLNTIHSSPSSARGELKD